MGSRDFGIWTWVFLTGRVIVAGLMLHELPTSPQLVNVEKVIPGIALDIRYATGDNFMGEAMYPSARCYLMKEVALSLSGVQDELKPQGYQLVVYDCYRPLSVQKQMFSRVPNPNFVADPAIGSRHNRGYAVDLSLRYLNGTSVPMPTAYDDFTRNAWSNSTSAPAAALDHRNVLRDAMLRHGFTVFPTEWWHFDHAGYEGKPNLDLSFAELDLKGTDITDDERTG
jgi:zinc D-Ala-D-Ala dipeptidase